MGFFKKLKEKIFNKKEETKKEIKDTKKVVPTKEQEKNKKVSKDIEKKKDQKKKETLKKEKENKQKFTSKIKKNLKIDKYVAGLSKSGLNFSNKIKELQNKHNKIDEDFFEELEEILIMSDISTTMVYAIIEEIKKEVKKENVTDKKLINEIIIDKMFAIYANQSIVDTSLNLKNEGLNILLVVGVNGSGKTTTIAKLIKRFKDENKKILVAAGDTFRAGAVEQLKIWSEKLGSSIVTPQKEGADPSSVVYTALTKAKEEKFDLLIIDTAGRLQNKVNLMNELNKMKKIINKFDENAPHESLLVLDATTGQNGINQARVFKEVADISGIVLTKMDGTSNGGIILSIKEILDIDVKLIGLGEKAEDLQEFDLDMYIYGLVQNLMEEENK